VSRWSSDLDLDASIHVKLHVLETYSSGSTINLLLYYLIHVKLAFPSFSQKRIIFSQKKKLFICSDPTSYSFCR
jgi:hypothetical protein